MPIYSDLSYISYITHNSLWQLLMGSRDGPIHIFPAVIGPWFIST